MGIQFPAAAIAAQIADCDRRLERLRRTAYTAETLEAALAVEGRLCDLEMRRYRLQEELSIAPKD